jgi:hypothetical protein
MVVATDRAQVGRSCAQRRLSATLWCQRIRLPRGMTPLSRGKIRTGRRSVAMRLALRRARARPAAKLWQAASVLGRIGERNRTTQVLATP